MKAGTDEDIILVLNNYKKVQMLRIWLSNSGASLSPDFPDNDLNVYKRKVLGTDESQDNYMQRLRRVFLIDEKIPSDESFSHYTPLERKIVELTPPNSEKSTFTVAGTVVRDRQIDRQSRYTRTILVTSVRFIHSCLIQIFFLGDTLRYFDPHHFIISMIWLLNSGLYID
mmetsp:Transcript_6654/g.7653  ORF Transcript_6654/g.7653 Transcript_6654/m.7653 type:complete len:170 (+) Transcript_6654:223-732(+)